MRPIEHYEVLLHSRRRLLEWVHAFTAGQFVREFPFGHRTVRATLGHLAGAEWLYREVVRRQDVNRESMPFTEATEADLDSLEAGLMELETDTRAWLESDQDFGRRLERTTTTPEGKRIRIVYTPEKVAFQMFYHEVRHRAHVMAMLRLMGVSVQNLDCSRQAYEWIELE